MKTIYINGDYITLENENIHAIMIENKKIKKVGTVEEVLKFKDSNTTVIDLEGKTIMPSFLDSHSHFFAVANSYLQVSLEDCYTFNQIIDKIKQFIEKNDIPKNKWIIANNYDHNHLEEKIHITKDILDKVIKDNPLILQHKSRT